MKPISTDVVSVLQELITQRKTNMQMIKISEVIAMKDICTSYTGGIKERVTIHMWWSHALMW